MFLCEIWKNWHLDTKCSRSTKNEKLSFLRKKIKKQPFFFHSNQIMSISVLVRLYYTKFVKKSVQNWIFLGKYLIFKKIWKILKKIHCLVKKFAFFTIGIQMARNSFFLLSIDHSLQENYFWLAKIFFEKTLIFLRRDVLILKKIWI